MIFKILCLALLSSLAQAAQPISLKSLNMKTAQEEFQYDLDHTDLSEFHPELFPEVRKIWEQGPSWSFRHPHLKMVFANRRIVNILMHGLTNLEKYSVSPFSRLCFEIAKRIDSMPFTATELPSGHEISMALVDEVTVLGNRFVLGSDGSDLPMRRRAVKCLNTCLGMPITQLQAKINAALFYSLEKYFYNQEFRELMREHFHVDEYVQFAASKFRLESIPPSLGPLVLELAAISIIKCEVQTTCNLFRGAVGPVHPTPNWNSFQAKLDWHSSQPGQFKKKFRMTLGPIMSIAAVLFENDYEMGCYCVLGMTVLLFILTSNPEWNFELATFISKTAYALSRK